jgi:hypothetical protein
MVYDYVYMRTLSTSMVCPFHDVGSTCHVCTQVAALMFDNVAYRPVAKR